jgi:hypothetical protein
MTSTARTVYGEIAECRTRRPLDLGIMATEQEEDGVERVPADGADLLLRDLRECKRSAPLEVDVVREREGRQRGQGRAREEVGRCPVCPRHTSATGSDTRCHHETHSQGTGGGRRQPRARSRGGAARMLRTCGTGLRVARHTRVSAFFEAHIYPSMHAQQDSQQLAATPMAGSGVGANAGREESDGRREGRGEKVAGPRRLPPLPSVALGSSFHAVPSSVLQTIIDSEERYTEHGCR